MERAGNYSGLFNLAQRFRLESYQIPKGRWNRLTRLDHEYSSVLLVYIVAEMINSFLDDLVTILTLNAHHSQGLKSF